MTTLTEQQVIDLAERAIENARNDKDVNGEGWTYCDALCLPIQDALGIDSGDVAAHFWSGREHDWDSLPTVIGYINFEIQWDEMAGADA
jgi:hypothetical protein